MATMRIALSKYSCSFEHHPQQNHEILEWLEWLEWLRFELFKQTWQTYRSIEEQSVNLLLAAQQPGTLWVVSPWFACCQQGSSQSQSQQSLVSTSASWHPEFISNSFPLLQRRVLFMFSPQRRFCLCISWKGGVSILVTPAPMISWTLPQDSAAVKPSQTRHSFVKASIGQPCQLTGQHPLPFTKKER